jgi:replicative DNA helicase
MSHPEAQLISKIIRTGDLRTVIQWGIVESDFCTVEAKSMFRNLRGFYEENNGSVPGENLFPHMYGTFELCDDASTDIPTYCKIVRKNRITRNFEDVQTEAHEMAQSEPLEALAFMQEKTQELLALGVNTKDMKLSEGARETTRRHDAARDGGGMTSALEWPWSPLNEATLGIQSDDYIVIYGRPKSMKSFVVTKMAAHLYECGMNHVMVYTKEMPAWQLFRRTVGFIARVPYDDLRLGRLNPQARAALQGVEEEVHEEEERTEGKHTITVVSGRDAPGGVDSIGWLRSKVEKYKPDAIIIDGLYLMASDKKTMKDEERVRTISRAARQMVLDYGTPLIATMQATRAAAKNSTAELDEIAYSDAIGQDATALIRCINEKLSPTLALIVGGAREFKLHGVRIHGIPCTDFTYKELMTEKEIMKAQETDAKPEEGEKNPDAHVKKPVRSAADPLKKAVNEARKSVDKNIDAAMG